MDPTTRPAKTAPQKLPQQKLRSAGERRAKGENGVLRERAEWVTFRVKGGGLGGEWGRQGISGRRDAGIRGSISTFEHWRAIRDEIVGRKNMYRDIIRIN